MKKIILILFILLFIFTFTSCKNKRKNGNEINPNPIEIDPFNEKDPPSPKNNLLLGEYSKGLDYLDEYVGKAVTEAIHRYINASASISKLSTIDILNTNKEDVLSLVDEALENWDDVLEIAAISSYLEGLEIEKLEEEVKKIERIRIKNRLIYNEEDPVKWAEAITKKYDEIQGNHKLQELSQMMGTDAKTAYKTLEVAQNILKGEYAQEEGKAQEWLAVLEATKTASKVGVFLCGTTLTCGTTALSPAGYLTYGEASGIVVSGVDCVLTIGSQGANIILGEDNKTAKKISNIADVYSKASFVYGIFNQPDSVGEKIAFIGDCIENVNSTVSYFFKVDPLAEGGQLVTKVIDNSISGDVSKDLVDIGLDGAFNYEGKEINEPILELDNFINNNKNNIIGDDLVLDLKIDDIKDEIVNDFNNVLPEVVSNAFISTNGVSFKEDSYNGYRYRGANGYLDGEQIQYHNGKFGVYVCMKKYYENGVCTKYQQFYEDSTIQSNGYYDAVTSNWVWEYYDDGYYSGHVKGALERIVYHAVVMPTNEELKDSITDGYELKYYDRSMPETAIIYNQSTGNPERVETKPGDGTSTIEIYGYDKDGNQYISSVENLDLDGTRRSYGYDENGKKTYIHVQYSDGSSDGQRFYYDVDDDGPYVKIEHYTNGELVSTTYSRLGDEDYPTSYSDDNPVEIEESEIKEPETENEEPETEEEVEIIETQDE